MDGPDGEQQRRVRYAKKALDALVYAVTWVAVLVAISALVSFLVGSGWVGVKYVLFFVGFFLFGISALQLRPKPAWKREDDEEPSERREETRFQAFVQRIPPLGRYGLPPDERLPPAAKLFVASVLALLVSFVMETGFGVAV
ncbi:MAG TPA: hypothetical protein VFJ06_02080 [Halococcus sp.]|nr:hypothetical protein [Halococcus sp.]